MPDPYGITQVDIPGIYGAVQSARMGRIQQMLGQQQVAAGERQALRENNLNIAVTRLFGGGQGGSSSSSVPGAAPPQNPVVAAYGGVPPAAATPAVTPPGLPGANPAGTPSVAAAASPAPSAAAPAAPHALDPAAVQQIIAADPVHGPALVQQLYQMNNEQLTTAQNRMKALAPLYLQAAQIPYAPDHGAARRAYIASIAPTLQQMGIDPQMATSWDPTDQALNQHMALGQTYAEALERIRGHLMTMQPGAVVVDTDHPDASGQPRVVAQSPLVPGPMGATYPRPASMDATLPRPRTQQERDALLPGQQYIAPDNTLHIVPGGPTPPASGNFPREDSGAFDFRTNPTPGG